MKLICKLALIALLGQVVPGACSAARVRGHRASERLRSSFWLRGDAVGFRRS
jgi:predicted DNA-binding ribbon-helix-helix protein